FDRPVVRRRPERRVERYAANVASRQLEFRQRTVVDAVERRARRKLPAPDLLAGRFIREGKLDNEPDAAEEGPVERALHVRGEHGEASVGLDSLKQVG